jgi:hypothetical protein
VPVSDGRILTLPPVANLSERGCVVLDQPQRAGKHSGTGNFPRLQYSHALRLVFDTAAFRGPFQDASDFFPVSV